MADQTYSAFLTIAYVKNAMNIGTNDESHNYKLIEYIDESNQEVDTAIHPYVDTPLPEGDALFPECRTAAMRYFRARWNEEVLSDLDKAKFHMDLFEKKMESIKMEFKARRTSRTKTVLISHDPRDEKIVLPSQASIFSFDNFP